MNDDQKNQRTSLMLMVATSVVLLCLAVVVWSSGLNEYAQGIVTLVIGRFLGYIDAGYAFEFGTTRGSKEKDTVIADLTSAAAVTEVAPAVKPAAPVVQPRPTFKGPTS